VLSPDRTLHARRRLAKVSRWLHIYGSMSAFAVVFFFAVTGFTLNHPQWFEGQQTSATHKGGLDASWTNSPSEAGVKRLEIVEHLRTTHGIQGALTQFRVDDRECTLTFKGPGYAADAIVERRTGQYELSETRMGFVAVVNDLHKGRDAGVLWRWFVDLAAGLLVFVSLTGLVLIWFVHRHRAAGLLLLAAGGVVSFLTYAIFVP